MCPGLRLFCHFERGESTVQRLCDRESVVVLQVRELPCSRKHVRCARVGVDWTVNAKEAKDEEKLV